MDSPGEILNLCRLCLVKDQVNIPIFEEQGDIRQIFLKISSCLPVTITRHDQLPKRICDACSNKLDLLYEFWNSSASAEKTLLSWLGQAGVEDAGEKISAVAQQIAKPAETLVKEESEALDESNLINESRDSFEDQSIDDEGTKDEAEAPPPKRARRTAAVKAQINITPESDEDEDDDFDAGEAMTKMEDESEESESDMKDDPSYSELPGTSADDQAGPSGVGKDGVEAPLHDESYTEVNEEIAIEEYHMSEYKNLGGLGADNNHTSHDERRKTFKRTTLRCKICDEGCSDLVQLNDHLLTHPAKFNVCEICNKTFKTKHNLARHKNEHLQQEQHDEAYIQVKEEITIEEHQLSEFENLGGLEADDNQTLDLKHENTLSTSVLSCKICSAPCRDLLQLNEHSTTHLQKHLACKVCHKIFKTKDNLAQHRKEHMQHDCKICQQRFTSASCLRIHSVVHSDERPYACDYCNSKFKRPNDFYRHRNIHTKEKHFECKFCHKIFFLLRHLYRHMVVHSDQYPFECDACKDRFKTEQTLHDHRNLHGKEKQYNCKTCHLRYKTKSNLTRHQNEKHTKQSKDD